MRIQMQSQQEKVAFEIFAERRRQIICEDFDEDHDHCVNSNGELAEAAACYAYTQVENLPWPWSRESDKRGKHDHRRQLVIAAALIIAEIERLDGNL